MPGVLRAWAILGGGGPRIAATHSQRSQEAPELPRTDRSGRLTRQAGARLHQFARYLARDFPVAFPVTLRIGSGRLNSEGLYDAGECWREGSRFFIRVTRCAIAGDMVESLIHEWAHLRAMRHAHLEDMLERHHHPHHDPLTWGVSFGELYSDLWDGDGWEDSKLC